MKTTASDISEFYTELSLLIKSELPLPETLRQLGLSINKKDFRQILLEMSECTANGEKLSETMREYPEYFSRNHVELIKVGEKGNILPSVLADLAKISRMNYQLYQMFKDILTYPVFTISISIFLFIMMAYFIIPQFEQIHSELLEGEPLPSLTQFVYFISRLIRNHFYLVEFSFALYVLFIFWIFSPSRTAYKYVMKIVNQIPFAEVITYNFDMARISSIWALFMKKQVSVTECFPLITQMIELPELKVALDNVSTECKKGQSLKSSIEKEKDMSELLKMLIANTPESKLPEELENISPLFMERAYYGCRRLGMILETFTLTGMVIVTGGIIILLFFPLIFKIF